jgi:hypothetical protein
MDSFVLVSLVVGFTGGGLVLEEIGQMNIHVLDLSLHGPRAG